jgi:hypothetical protein
MDHDSRRGPQQSAVVRPGRRGVGTNLHALGAIYGEYALTIDRSTGARMDAFHGRNQSMRGDRNTEFSAIGRLKKQDSGKMTVTLFENVSRR